MITTTTTQSGALLEDPGHALAGRYLLQERIGEGGSAVVHRARDLRLGGEVAVKIYRTSAPTPEERDRRRREVRMLTEARHSAVVGLLDHGGIDIDGEEHDVVVLELFEPSDRAAGWFGASEPHLVGRVGAQIAGALAHLHALGVVHRDVKPDNILVRSRLLPAGSATVEAKLGDFGIARSIDDARHTRSDVLVGTAAYLSPEHLGDGTVGPASDVYSLGLVLLEAITGARAYTGTTLEISLQRMHHAPVVPASVPPEWRPLLTAMTALDPAARPTAAEVARLLGAGLRPAGPARRPLRELIATAASGLAAAVASLGLATSVS